MKNNFFVILLVIGPLLSLGQTATYSEDSVKKYFSELEVVLQYKEAAVWKKSLKSPLLFVDRNTRDVFANQADKEGSLKSSGSIYIGKLPTSVNIANTAMTWAGVKWTMVMLPVSKVRERRMRLVVHELFHRIQDDLGLPPKNPIVDHLDTKEGRIYFRLELEALRAALHKPVGDRKEDLESALIFRAFRQQLFNGAKEKEQQLEFNEGLAEFTGVYVSRIFLSDKDYLSNIVTNVTQNYPTFSRSLGYITGPLYGIILAQKKSSWNLSIKASDHFSELLAKTYNLKMPEDLTKQAKQRMTKYQGSIILKEEEQREDERISRERRYREVLVNGPVLKLVHSSANNFSFDPNSVVPFGEYGSVFNGLTMTDEWGRLVVSDVAIIANWNTTIIPVVSNISFKENRLNGPGWELELKPGWKIVAGERHGDFLLEKE